MPPRVFTIPSSVPFLPTLIDALSDGRVVDGFAPDRASLGFAGATIFLPTRRACRLARDAFLEVLDVDAALLPRIVAIGDIDEDEFAFADAATGAGAFDALALPPALDAMERRFLLARLVRKWADGMALVTGAPPLVVRHPAAVLALADDLARLMDDMTTREVPWRRLDDLVPDQFDEYWKLTLQFLKIAREEWPNLLAALGVIDAAARRDCLIAAEASRLAAAAPGAPVIAAGSTGSMPSTAKLLATIASLPNGAVVLPGLDTELDEEGWNAIGGVARGPGAPPAPAAVAVAGHPQFAIHALLTRIGIARRDVGLLVPPVSHGRETLVSEALRPAASTDQWRTRLAEQRFTDAIAHGLDGVTVIAAGNAEEEALAIAVALRESLTEPTRIAALVTPDRALARRVGVMLQRWNVAAEDSGGDKLADTPAGAFARLAVEAAFDGLAPAALLALLKHKLARLGADETRHRRAVAALERAILRGPRPRPGSVGLAGAVATLREEIAKLRRGETSEVHFSDPRAALSDAELAEAEALVGRIASALAPLEGLVGTRHFAELAVRHRQAIAALGTDSAGAVGAFSGADGEALAAAFDDIAGKVGADPFDVAIEDYAELFRLAIDDRVVRRSGAPSSCIRIYGPLEARLVGIDRVVIGGLVEGVWPPDPRTDAWLSRPMRQNLGLDLPERRIGLSAHDFAQLLGAREVFLTHAVKLNGAPTVPSRFLQRLAAVAGDRRWGEAVARGERYRALARSLDAPRAPPRPVGRPEPRPPVSARPKSLSVTEIEHWLRDPYTIYAKHILKLPQLDPIDQRPGAAERGSIIHGAVGDFAKSFVEALPADPVPELLRLGALRFAPLGDFPEVRAFWWPRFERIARWFADYERTRRAGMTATHAEIRGELAIATSRAFRLTGRADRIERRADGRYAIIDFKTGAPPSSPQVLIGLAPQLTLEAAMLRRGGFPGIAAGGRIAELVYVRLNGGDPPGLERVVDLDGRSPDAVADAALTRLITLVRRFEDERTPYRSLILSMWSNRYGTYDDLARVKEWSLAGGAEEPDMPGVQP